MADSSSHAAGTAQPTLLVVRTASGWFLTPPDDRDPVECSIDALVGHLRTTASGDLDPDAVATHEADPQAAPSTAPEHGRTTSTRASTPLPRPLEPGAHLEPVTAFVAKVGGRCLVVEDPSGRPTALDEVDVRLLDALVEPATADELFQSVQAQLGAATPDQSELGSRLRRVAETIPLRVLHDPPPDDGTPAAETTSSDAPSLLPARRARSVVRHVVPPAVRRAARSAAARSRGAEAVPSDADQPSAPEATELPRTVEASTPEPEDGADAGRSARVRYLDDPTPPGASKGLVPVYSVWKVDVGPALSLGMLTANARHHDGGALNDWYEIRRPEDPTSFLDDLATRTGPALLLLSNYVWSLEHNLELAARAKALHPELIVVHGGPSTPKYEGDAVSFFAEHESADVAVRGEGEVTLAALLEALGPALPAVDLSRLAGVAGLTYRDPATGEAVRNDDRERVADLDSLPSPYLTGEFDHIHPDAWDYVTLETNRGCPYGCTFCDWGSSTLARIRKFSDERVAGEMDWAGKRRYVCWALADANFGIMSRDVATTETMVAVKERYGFPNTLGFNVAKNTTKHLITIVDRLAGAGIAPVFTLALQTRDEATLEAVQRTNIATEHYVALAASLRRRGLPAQADIMIALPGQTVQSLSDDLQFLLDHEISARMWITQMLPNAPINDPEYRERWQVRSANGVVVSTSSFTEDDREEMLRIRHAYTVFERFGMLRHVVRFLQWDEGVPALQVIRRLLAVSDERPGQYPLISWVLHYFDFFNVPPLGWRAFTDEVRRFILDELDVGPSSQLDTVLALQAFLMPSHGRRFPDTMPLDHDYLAYFQEHTAHLWSADAPVPRRLEDHAPTTFTIYGDPLGRCDEHGMQVIFDPREQTMTDDFWLSGHWELDSPLVVDYADVVGAGTYLGIHESIPADLPDEPAPSSTQDRLAAVRVSLGSRSGPASDS